VIRSWSENGQGSSNFFFCVAVFGESIYAVGSQCLMMAEQGLAILECNVKRSIKENYIYNLGK